VIPLRVNFTRKFPSKIRFALEAANTKTLFSPSPLEKPSIRPGKTHKNLADYFELIDIQQIKQKITSFFIHPKRVLSI
jgi:hypothetical protein